MPAKKAPEIRPLPAVDFEQPHAAALLPLLRRERVPSLLFTGPEGTGKEWTAIDFARTLCCTAEKTCAPGAPRCESCMRAGVLEHPGIHLVYPTPTQGSNEADDGDVNDLSKVLDEKRTDIFARYRFTKKASIRMARARAVIQRANTKPFDSRYHVFIFINAHAMRDEAQNALLKIVEEPPAHSVVIFTTTNPDGILYTIRSRCQRVRFTPLKPAVVEGVLRDYYGVAKNLAERAALLSHGSIDRARALVESFDESDREAAAELVEGLARGGAGYAAGFALARARGANREGVARFLDEVSLLFRDLMAGEEDLYINRDIASRLAPLREVWDRAALPGIIERVGEARAQILLANSNIDSTLAATFLGVARQAHAR